MNTIPSPRTWVKVIHNLSPASPYAPPVTDGTVGIIVSAYLPPMPPTTPPGEPAVMVLDVEKTLRTQISHFFVAPIAYLTPILRPRAYKCSDNTIYRDNLAELETLVQYLPPQLPATHIQESTTRP